MNEHGTLEQILMAVAYKCAARPLKMRPEMYPDGSAPNKEINTEPILLEDFFDEFKELWIYSDNNKKGINYSEFSGPLFLLMHKNISVTNCGCAEIKSLLQLYSKCEDTSKYDHTLSFFSEKQYTDFFKKLFESAFRCTLAGTQKDEITIDDIENAIPTICKNFGHLLKTTVLLNIQFTSAIVHMPPTITVNVNRVVSESGYIHSGGLLIYTRKLNEATTDAFKTSLIQMLKRHNRKKMYLSVYSDEYFSKHDYNSPISVRNGLSGVKIQSRKQYIGDVLLIDYVTHALLDDELKDLIYIPPSMESYKKERQDFLDGQGCNCEKKHSIWMIVDCAVSIDSSTSQRNSDVTSAPYLLVYEQAIINQNQLLLYKERKPGWSAPITLPHTLSTAIFNISYNKLKTNRKTTKRVVFIDPFFGTGTTLIDASLRLDDAIIIGFDRDRVAAQLTKDNLKFFAFSKERDDFIKSLKLSINLIGEALKDNSRIENTDSNLKNKSGPNDVYFIWAFKIAYKHIIDRENVYSHINNILLNQFDDLIYNDVFQDSSADIFYRLFLVHPVKEYFASWMAMILSLKNSISLNP